MSQVTPLTLTGPGWEELLKETFAKAARRDDWPVWIEPRCHTFSKGQKVEAVHPWEFAKICPATVTTVEEDKFVVQIDDLVETNPEKLVFITCDPTALNIMPAKWSEHYGVKLTPPNGWKNIQKLMREKEEDAKRKKKMKADKKKMSVVEEDAKRKKKMNKDKKKLSVVEEDQKKKCEDDDAFSWDLYLKHTKAPAAPKESFVQTVQHTFEPGMKLEVENPLSIDEVCVATITRVRDRLVWVTIDGPDHISSRIFDVRSKELHPVGWCSENNVPLISPSPQLWKSPMLPSPQTFESQDDYRHALHRQVQDPSHLCPPVYINAKCYRGEHLAEGWSYIIPHKIEAGPVPLVMRGVIQIAIKKTSDPVKVLKILSERPTGTLSHLELFKAILKPKDDEPTEYSRAYVAVPQSIVQVREFLRQTCIQLGCCPNLFSLSPVPFCMEGCDMICQPRPDSFWITPRKRKLPSRFREGDTDKHPPTKKTKKSQNNRNILPQKAKAPPKKKAETEKQSIKESSAPSLNTAVKGRGRPRKKHAVGSEPRKLPTVQNKENILPDESSPTSPIETTVTINVSPRNEPTEALEPSEEEKDMPLQEKSSNPQNTLVRKRGRPKKQKATSSHPETLPIVPAKIATSTTPDDREIPPETKRCPHRMKKKPARYDD